MIDFSEPGSLSLSMAYQKSGEMLAEGLPSRAVFL